MLLAPPETGPTPLTSLQVPEDLPHALLADGTTTLSQRLSTATDMVTQVLVVPVADLPLLVAAATDNGRMASTLLDPQTSAWSVS